jgi:hypothetical protein
MILHVDRAEYIDDHSIHLWFNDGTDGQVDLRDVLTGPIFEPLREVAFFRRFTLEGGTVAWENGADFAPEYLRELMHAQLPTPAR